MKGERITTVLTTPNGAEIDFKKFIKVTYCNAINFIIQTIGLI